MIVGLGLDVCSIARARAALEELAPGGQTQHPVDAAIVAIVDRYDVYPEAGEDKEL